MREAIVGSFDVLIARGSHKTNRIMTVLTLTSVILLPGALLAGVMGMNFNVSLFDNSSLFWIVVAVSLPSPRSRSASRSSATGSDCGSGEHPRPRDVGARAALLVTRRSAGGDTPYTP